MKWIGSNRDGCSSFENLLKLPSYFCKLDIFHKIGKEDFEPKFLNTFLRYGTWENWCLCVCVFGTFNSRKMIFLIVKNLVYLIDSII